MHITIPDCFKWRWVSNPELYACWVSTSLTELRELIPCVSFCYQLGLLLYSSESMSHSFKCVLSSDGVILLPHKLLNMYFNYANSCCNKEGGWTGSRLTITQLSFLLKFQALNWFLLLLVYLGRA